MGMMTAAVLGSAAIGAMGARSAGRAQERAADGQLQLGREQMAENRRIYDDQTQRFSPFLGAGTNALAAYQYELGLGEAPMIGGTMPEIQRIGGQPAAGSTGGGIMGQIQRASGNAVNQSQGGRFQVNGQTFNTRAEAEAFARQNITGGTQYQGISMSPGTQFALSQGRDTIEAGAAMRGGINSGATLAGLERLRMGMAAQDRDSQLNRLGGLADMGMGAAGMQANAGNALAANNANSTQFMGNALANRGNAQAAGAVGVGNALQGAISNGIGLYGYQQQMNAARPQ